MREPAEKLQTGLFPTSTSNGLFPTSTGFFHFKLQPAFSNLNFNRPFQPAIKYLDHLIFYNLYSLYARFARRRAGMMHPVVRSDISANEVSHSLFSKSIPIEIDS